MGYRKNRKNKPTHNKEEALRKEILMKVLSFSRGFRHSRMTIMEVDRYVNYILNNTIPEKSPDESLNVI